MGDRAPWQALPSKMSALKPLFYVEQSKTVRSIDLMVINDGSSDFEVDKQTAYPYSDGITESRIVVFDTVYTINPGEPLLSLVSRL